MGVIPYQSTGGGAAMAGMMNAVQQSRVNAAWKKIEMLDGLWHKVSNRWLNGQLYEMHFVLMNVWIELEADSLPSHQNDYYELEERILKAFGHFRRTRQKKLWSDAADLLRTQWMLLKRVEKSQGLGKAYKDEDKEDIF